MGKLEALLQKASDSLELPLSVAAGMPLMEMQGNSRFIIQGHKGIKEYGKEIIILDTLMGQLKIQGSELEIKLMDESSIVVSGNIRTLDLPDVMQ